MPNDIATLKIDFKLDPNGTLRIIDLGDGLGADTTGFEDTRVNAKLLRDMHEATGAPVVTVFGELPQDAMRPESIHVPLVLREFPVNDGQLVDAEDLAGQKSPFLPYSEIGRLQSYISLDWSQRLPKGLVTPTPVGLIAMEMHKILWYFLMEKLMKLKDQPSVLYWSNNTDPTSIDLTKINFSHGVFIKIADRSQGGGDGVYYAKNQTDLLKCLTKLRIDYDLSPDNYKEHIFVIEPAYLTVRQHQGKDYNVTGRAFITLVYNRDTQNLDVKIAAAKWMFPLKPLQGNMAQDKMLSNIGHSIQMVSLTPDELEILSSGIRESYGSVFTAGFTHSNLMEYCQEHPVMAKFRSCMRPNASYLISLKQLGEDKMDSDYLRSQISQLVGRDHLDGIQSILRAFSLKPSFFQSSIFSKKDDKIDLICLVFFFLRFIACAKTWDREYREAFPFIPEFIAREKQIQSLLDKLIQDFLLSRSKNYDIVDPDRALRQAAKFGDAVVIKLLVYTRRANVNACSPTNKTALDNANECSDAAKKELCVLLLGHAGAKQGTELQTAAAAATLS